MNYSATSYRASCFIHHCLVTRNASLSLTQCPQALGLDSPYPTGDVFLGSCLCGAIYPQTFLLYIDCCVLVTAHSKTATAFHRAKTQILHFQMTRSAAMTYLAGREPFVHFDQMFSSVSEFVFQQSKKNTITIIQSGFAIAKALVRHGLHI